MAVKAPKVEALAKSMATLDPAYSEQRGLVNEQIEGLDSRYGSQRDAIEGTRVQAFDDIAEAASGTGRAFSGIPLHEQSRYLANSYLPGLQAIDERQDQERMQLRGTLADINSQQATAAIGRIDQQQQALNQWNLSQAQIQAQRREAELQRQFQRSERVAGQQFTAGQNAANRAASAASGAGASNAARASLINSTRSALNSHKGGDNRVSRNTWNTNLDKWLGQGGDMATYASLFGNYAHDHYAGIK